MVTEVDKSTEANKATNRRFYEEVINQKHLVVLDEVASTNYVSHSFPPGLPPGREGLKAFVGAFHAAFPDGHLSIDQMIAEGDTVATRLTFRGTHTGNFMGIPPTGKNVTVPALDMARYADGKLVEHWGGPDQMSLMQQLGVVPMPGQAR
jgi:predicted ester cyclase